MTGDFLDCDACQTNFTLTERRCFGCGWLPPGEHIAGDRPYPEASVCPGYTTRMPEVCEAARARSWAGRGGLVPLYGSRPLPQVALDAIDMLENAINEVEARTYRERRAEAEAQREG